MPCASAWIVLIFVMTLVCSTLEPRSCRCGVHYTRADCLYEQCFPCLGALNIRAEKCRFPSTRVTEYCDKNTAAEPPRGNMWLSADRSGGG
jgi:hypothetical protein